MIKKIFALLTISLFIVIASVFAFLAGKDVVFAKEKPEIPEVNGTYNDPDHPGIKVRVFVHQVRGGKPNPTPTPVLQCELADPDSSTNDIVDVWRLSSPWTYNLNVSNVPPLVGSGNWQTIAGNSFGDWASASGNKIKFNRGSDTTVSRQAYDGFNIVAWGRTQGTALAVTYIRYDSSGKVVDVDTIMNQKFAWAWSDPSGWSTSQNTTCAYQNYYDAEDILTHELGHWMGLDDAYTSDYINNTMYGYGATGETKKDTLTAGDILPLSSIYY